MVGVLDFGMGISTLSPFFIGLFFWEIIWKGFALWRAGRRNQPRWFFLLFILNTAGILPIIYLYLTREKKGYTSRIPAPKKKKK
ncbi:MAG: DUF5652 family protein [archaeon]